MLISPITEAISNTITTIGLPGILIIFTFIIIFFIVIIFISIKNKVSFGISIGPFKIRLGRSKEMPCLEAIQNVLAIKQDDLKKEVELRNESLNRQLNYVSQKLSQLKFI